MRMARASRPTSSGKARPDGPHDVHDDRSSAGDARLELEAILKRAARGDQNAWRILVETYTARVFGLIRAQCGSPDLAEEITQSAFCTVVAKIGSYTELGRFEQWLFRIAMNRLRDEMRRRKRQARPMEDQALHAMADNGGTAGGPGGSVSQGAGSTDRRSGSADNGFPGADPEQLAALRLALADLPEADQQIIHLRHSAGLSFKEIAEVLEQPLGTVLARQHRALKKLAETLQPVMDADASIGRVRRKPGDSPAPARGPGFDVQASGP